MTPDVSAQTKTCGDSSSLSVPAVPRTFKQQCDDMVAFCYRAHQLSVESAQRCGVSQNLIEKLNVQTHPSHFTELSDADRQHLLTVTSAAIRVAAPEHSGSFPDFIGYAKSIRTRFERFVMQGLDPIGEAPQTDEVGDPTSVANIFLQSISITLDTAHDMEQRQNALVLLSALGAATKGSLPGVSSEALDIRSRVFQNEIDNTIPFSVRR